MFFSLRKMGYSDALDIVSWKYPVPYEIYNLHNSPIVVIRLVDGRYYSVFAADRLVGFFCYGPAGQLKNRPMPSLYQNKKYLDVGLGMHPSLCGRGLGCYFVEAGLTYAQKAFGTNHFRLTVAADNTRAIKVYSRLGFSSLGSLWNGQNPISEFIVMTRDNFEPTLKAAQIDLNVDLTIPSPTDN